MANDLYYDSLDNDDLTLVKEMNVIKRHIEKMNPNKESDFNGWCGGVSKNDKLASMFIDEGRKLLKLEKYPEALRAYNKAIAFATSNSKELVTAYVCRTKYLFIREKYEHCIEDCESIDKISAVDDIVRAKLRYRKTECYLALKDRKIVDECMQALKYYEKLKLPHKKKANFVKKTQQILDEAMQNLNSLKDVVREEKDENDEKTMKFYHFQRQTKIPSISNKLEVRLDENGDGVMKAAVDINIGEVLVIEKNYDNHLTGLGQHLFCANCSNSHYILIPCDKCASAVYCSKECKDDHWGRCHKYECNVFPETWEGNVCTIIDGEKKTIPSDKELSMGWAARLAIIAVVKAQGISGLKQQLTELQTLKNSKNKQTKYCNEIFSSEKSACLLGLKIKDSNTKLDPKNESLVNAIPFHVCQAVFYLALNTEFFGRKYQLRIDDVLKIKDVTFMAALMLRIRLILLHNTMCSNSSYLFRPTMEYVLFGTSFNAVSTLTKHSCNPNAIKFSNYKNESVLISLRKINKGSQIYISNNLKSYQMMSDEEIQNIRQTCSCPACTAEWTVKQGLTYRDVLEKKNPILMSTILADYDKVLKIEQENNSKFADCYQYDYPSMKELLKFLNSVDSNDVTYCSEFSLLVALMTRIYVTNLGNRYITDECKAYAKT